MFALNDIVDGKAEGRFRVLYVEHSQERGPLSVAWVFDMEDRLALPRPIELALLREKLGARAWSIVAPGQLQSTPSNSAATKQRAKKAMDIIREMIVYPDIFDPAWRSQHVQEAAALHRCSPQTVMSYLRRYFRGGQTSMALSMAFHRSGISKDGVQPVSQAVVGNTKNRGQTAAEYQTYQMTADDHAKIKAVSEEALKKGVAHAVHSVITKHYSYVDGNGIAYARPFGERPSHRQIRYSIGAQFSLETRLRKKHGDGVYELDRAPTLASAVESVRGIGEVYEIDATIFDCQLVARADRSRTIGKPSGYHIIDRRSQLCVGSYITLETIAWSSAVLAICSLSESKRELCERYNVPYDPADWPAEGLLPASFAADRGEMLCRNSDSVPLLGTRVTNNPARLPRRKSLVEASFHLIPQIIRDETPGYEVPGEFRKRTGKKYGQDATLTLDEFIRAMLVGIISYNRRVLLDYPAPVGMNLEGIPITPLNVWAWEREHGNSYALSRFPAESIRQRLLPVDDAVINGSGIQFRGLTYRCNELERRGAFVQAARSSSDLKVSYDSRVVDTIYVHDPKSPGGGFLVATLSRERENFLGLSFSEVKAIQSLSATQRQQKEQTASDLAMYRSQVLGGMFEQAKAEAKKATTGKSRASRRADMKADRDAELRERRIEASERAVGVEFPADREDIPSAEAPKSPAATTPVAPPAPHPQSLAARLAAKRMEVANGK